MTSPVVIGVVLVGFLVGVWLFVRSRQTGTDGEKRKKQTKAESEIISNKAAAALAKKIAKPSKKPKREPRKKAGWLPSHDDERFIATLKAHEKGVLGIVSTSKHGGRLASISEDRTLRLWRIKDLTSGGGPIRVNLGFDYATAVGWAPNGQHCLVSFFDTKRVTIYNASEKDRPHEVQTFERKHDGPILSVDMTNDGSLVLTCSGDTKVTLWEKHGKVVTEFKTNQMRASKAAFSSDSRFFGVAAWTGEVKLFEIKKDKKGEKIASVDKVMDLTGHRSGIQDLAWFPNDWNRIVTLSKDGTLKIWNIDVRYHVREDPKVVLTIDLPFDPSVGEARVAITPDQERMVVTSGKSLHVFTVSDGKCVASIDDVASGDVTSVCITPDSKNAVVGSSTDKVIRVFRIA